MLKAAQEDHPLPISKQMLYTARSDKLQSWGKHETGVPPSRSSRDMPCHILDDASLVGALEG